ncbi:kinase-like protein [Trametes cingulata]|nr:kinase-like protein [Trametes cingulata]
MAAILNTTETKNDGIFNYELLEEIGRGTTAIVYRATCRRGRLRNRQVAVKKISRTSGNVSSLTKIISVTPLHSALYHPSILSLISCFNAPSGYYHVMELCPKGTLADLLCARVSALAENEVRGVARALVDALIYLKKELVLHRDVNPNHLLITEDGRVKLSGFSSAVRLTAVNSTATDFCGSANYVSPEILLANPYSFEADLWSVGCILLTCSSGQPAFHGSGPDEVYDNICNVKYSLPEAASSEVRELIASILQKRPQDRVPLHRVPSHPFFKSSAVAPLAAPAHTGSRSRPTPQIVPASPTGRSPARKQYPSLLSRNPERPRPVSGSGANGKKYLPGKRTPLEDITNLYSEGSQTDDGENLIRSPPARTRCALASARPRLFSQTRTGTIMSSRPTAPAPEIQPSQRTSGSLAGSRVQSSDYATQRSSPRSQLRRVLSDSNVSPRTRRTMSLPSARPVLFSGSMEAVKTARVSSQATTSTAVSQPRSPQAGKAEKEHTRSAASSAGHTSLVALNTYRLKPETHKVSRGQLVVLPSRALLVDFREGERRKGGRGKEVLVIASDGATIDIYDAPHLSTPCCLAEPTGTYAFSQLPQRYVKHYSDAARLVDQLKSRIPKLVHYTDEAKCTLMANGPPGEIEIAIPPEEHRTTQRDALRLRLSRKGGTIEFSRYSGRMAKGRKDLGEWSKRVISLGPEQDLAGRDECAEDDIERQAMRHLSEFLRICEAAEEL